jgi:ATP-dependent DNA helicase RecG
MANPGLKDRMHFANECLQPAVDAGLIEMTIPDKPQSSKQKCRFTDAGRTPIEQHGRDSSETKS